MAGSLAPEAGHPTSPAPPPALPRQIQGHEHVALGRREGIGQPEPEKVINGTRTRAA